MFFFFLFDGINGGGSIPETNTPNDNLFEKIKHIDDDGVEFWYARELQTVLGYSEWRNFNKVIDKAKIACKSSGYIVSSEFVDVNKLVYVGANLQREVQDIVLSRYACYLIAMNGDPRKETIALAQTYFTVKTREREISEHFDELTENKKRILIRQDLRKHNSSLAEAANQAGVKAGVEYAIFQNYGYKGLYGGLDAKAIHKLKGLKKNQQILDHMGSTELAANLFRATQTDDKLRRENIKGINNANRVHYEVGATVRRTIKELGGTMPENLPTPKESIKQLESKNKSKKLK